MQKKTTNENRAGLACQRRTELESDGVNKVVGIQGNLFFCYFYLTFM